MSPIRLFISHSNQDKALASGAPPVESRLAREMGTWTATAVVVGSVIGSGIFQTPGLVAGRVDSLGALALLWVLGGMIALAGALSLAEMAASFPNTGGMYVFLRETYGPWAAFLFGWGMLVANPAAYAGGALIFGQSLARIVPALQGWEREIGAGSLLLLVALNIRPVRVGALVLNTATWIKVFGLVALAALAYALSDGIEPGWRAKVTMAPHSWPGFGLALILVMGAYDGWQWVPQLAGELKNPARALPRALGGGVLIVVAVYLATNASVLVLSPSDVTTSSLVAADVARHVLGAAGGALVAALMAVSTFGSNQSGMMTDPRVFFAMAQDRLFFRSVGAIHPRHRTPHVAVALIGLGGILYLYVRNFEELVGTLILGLWPFLALSVAAVIIQRRRDPARPRPYRVPLYPAVPLFFLAACAGIFANSFREQPRFTILNLAVLVAGLPIYLLWRSRAKREAIQQLASPAEP
jgi:APA family basic amino acid/polyamine antiporter